MAFNFIENFTKKIPTITDWDLILIFIVIYFTSSKITIYENQLVMVLWYKYDTDKRS